MMWSGHPHHAPHPSSRSSSVTASADTSPEVNACPTPRTSTNFSAPSRTFLSRRRVAERVPQVQQCPPIVGLFLAFVVAHHRGLECAGTHDRLRLRVAIAARAAFVERSQSIATCARNT